jgi:P27 family predicted phage terminase small subunit
MTTNFPPPPKNPRLDTPPDPPADLPDSARRAWQEIAKAAVAVKSLTSADLSLLELAARALAAVRDLEAAVERQGTVIDTGSTVKANPALAALDRARGHCRGFLKELRLTPESRRY